MGYLYQGVYSYVTFSITPYWLNPFSEGVWHWDGLDNTVGFTLEARQNYQACSVGQVFLQFPVRPQSAQSPKTMRWVMSLRGTICAYMFGRFIYLNYLEYNVLYVIYRYNLSAYFVSLLTVETLLFFHYFLFAVCLIVYVLQKWLLIRNMNCTSISSDDSVAGYRMTSIIQNPFRRSNLKRHKTFESGATHKRLLKHFRPFHTDPTNLTNTIVTQDEY